MAKTSLRFLVLGDVHIGGVPKILGEELQTTAHTSIFNQIENYALENEIEYVIQLGDFYDSPNPTDDEKSLALALLNKSKLKWFIQRGNHEYVDRNTNSFNFMIKLYEFGLNKHVRWITDPALFKIKGIPFLFLPWPHKKHKILKKQKCLVFAHVPRKGAMVDNGRKITEIDYDFDLMGSFWFIGDLHTPQKGKDYEFPGAPLQGNFGDGEKRQFLDVTIDSSRIDRPVISRIPFILPFKLKTLSIKTDADLDQLMLHQDYFLKLKIAKEVATPISEITKQWPNVVKHDGLDSATEEKVEIMIENENSSIIREDLLRDSLRKQKFKKAQIKRGLNIAKKMEKQILKRQ